MKSVNPATGELIRDYPEFSDQLVSDAVNATRAAFLDWRYTDFTKRAVHMRQVAAILRAEKDSLALLMTLEMGKPIRDARAEVEKCAAACEYYAENAAQMLADEPVTTESSRSFIAYQPVGVVLAVMPWNFPFWQVIRFAVPALMAGNGAVLKHASNVSGCALALEGIFRKAGFPENLFRTLLISGQRVTSVIGHPNIAAVTLTGSVEAGRSVSETCGKYLKKSVLELGGSDPYLVLEDADIAHAAETCARSRLINSGQSCIAAKRFIVVDEVYNDFLESFTAAMKKRRMGDPTDPETDIGPQSSLKLRNDLAQQVESSVKAGATIILGGKIPEGPGAFYPATILADVTPGMPAYSEELFGPVASLIRVRNEIEAVNVANDSRFGLGAAVFTQDAERGESIARKLESGCVAVNDFVKSDPRLPFGGIKESGYGRELSTFGIREFVNIRSIVIA